MGLVEDFTKAAEDVKNLKKKPTDSERLEVYGLYKQVIIGDNETAKPGMMNLEGQAKWDAWTKKKGMSKDAAMEAYVAKVKELQGIYN